VRLAHQWVFTTQFLYGEQRSIERPIGTGVPFTAMPVPTDRIYCRPSAVKVMFAHVTLPFSAAGRTGLFVRRSLKQAVRSLHHLFASPAKWLVLRGIEEAHAELRSQSG
jgi:hypothetical protein